MSVNKVILVGNVGKDPETRYLDEGVAVSKFSLATSEVYRNKGGEKVTTTEWHNIVLRRGLAQIAEKYIRKGSQVYIEGRIRNRSYDDRDGNKRYITEIVCDNLQMLGKRQDGSGSDQQAGQDYDNNTQAQPAAPKNEQATGEEAPSSSPESEPDDLPF